MFQQIIVTVIILLFLSSFLVFGLWNTRTKKVKDKDREKVIWEELKNIPIEDFLRKMEVFIEDTTRYDSKLLAEIESSPNNAKALYTKLENLSKAELQRSIERKEKLQELLETFKSDPESARQLSKLISRCDKLNDRINANIEKSTIAV